jgi:type II secretory pathway component PulF
MPKFRYRAVDSEGRPAEGVLEEESSRQVVALLREQGYQVNDVQRLVGPSRRRAGVSWSDLHLFNEQLRGLVRSGLPLPEGLEAMAYDLQNPRLRAAIEDMRLDLERGNSLESAFARQGSTFPPMYQTMIRAGERSGNLSEVLEALTEWSQRMVTRRHALQVVIAYPLLVIAGALMLMVFLLLWVIPTFEETFSEFGGALPWPTQLVFGMSHALQGNDPAHLAGVLLLAFGAFVALAIMLLKNRHSRVWEAIFWHLPLLGPVYRAEAAARFSRTAAALLRSGVGAPEALRLAGEASGSASVEVAAYQAAKDVEAGHTLSAALAASGAFSHTFCWMVSMGEKSGELVTALASIAATEDRRADTLARLALTLIGPVVIVLIGLAIGFFVTAIYMPIFSLGDAISGA